MLMQQEIYSLSFCVVTVKHIIQLLIIQLLRFSFFLNSILLCMPQSPKTPNDLFFYQNLDVLILIAETLAYILLVLLTFFL